MKRIAWLAPVILLLCACSIAAPDAGHQMVWVKKPILFGHGGIDKDPVTTGREYGAVSSDPVDVSMLPQRVDMEFDDMMTSSGVPVNFHVVITFVVTDAVEVVSKFGADRTDKTWGFWDRSIDQPIRTAVRDAVKKRDMQQMAIDQTAADSVGAEVMAAATKIVATVGVPIKITGLNVGRVNPPDAIKTQRIETAAQEQRVITEKQRKLAEDQRKMAEESRASADNAYNAKMQLTPQQYVQLEQIKIEADRVKMLEKVCAGGKCTFLMSSGNGGATPVFPVGKP